MALINHLPPLDMTRLPKHVAIIMDGNGRWAKKHKLQVAVGHETGTEALREIIRNSSDIGIEALSLYAFSTENWARPQSEVDALMALILRFFASEIDELCRKNVAIRILGDKAGLPPKQRDVLIDAENRTKDNTGLKLNIAVNYGSHAEIAMAVSQIAAEAVKGEIQPGDITPRMIEDHLYTKGLPPVDLLIRTSGEQRLSNFMLFQLAYAEFVFPTVLWPDFSVKHYHEALREFQSRARRYGKREA